MASCPTARQVPLEPAALIALAEVEHLRTKAFERGEARDWRDYTERRAAYRGYTLRRFRDIETADCDESEYL